jgi:hypothetical protein
VREDLGGDQAAYLSRSETALTGFAPWLRATRSALAATADAHRRPPLTSRRVLRMGSPLLLREHGPESREGEGEESAANAGEDEDLWPHHVEARRPIENGLGERYEMDRR